MRGSHEDCRLGHGYSGKWARFSALPPLLGEGPQGFPGVLRIPVP